MNKANIGDTVIVTKEHDDNLWHYFAKGTVGTVEKVHVGTVNSDPSNEYEVYSEDGNAYLIRAEGGVNFLFAQYFEVVK